MHDLIECLKLSKQINYYYLTSIIALRRLDPMVKLLVPNKIVEDNTTSKDETGENKYNNNSNIPNAENNNKVLEGICKRAN